MDQLRKEKVDEAADKAVTKCRNGVAAGAKPAAKTPAAAAAPAAAPPKPRGPPARLLQRAGGGGAAPAPAEKENAAPPASAPVEDEPPAPRPAARGPPARLVAKKPAAPAPPAAAPPAARKPPPAARPAAAAAPAGGASKPSEPLRFKHSQESAEAQVDSGDVFPAEVVAQLADANWKQRLEGMDKLTEWVKLDGRDADAEVLVRYLVGKKPGPKESNFQVCSRRLHSLFALARTAP